ncbi:MAG: site-2 protease family protein [Chloroflexota bacterium]
MIRFASSAEEIAALVFVAIFAFAYHELGHALSADYLGDPTPREHGRITLNPFRHLDVVGMLLLLLIGFGWATTPVRPWLLRGNKMVSHALVAVAGPAMNLLMAALFALPLRLVNMGLLDPALIPSWAEYLFVQGVFWNVLLMLFNMLPIPPLDGFTVLVGFLPKSLGESLMQLRRYSLLLFVGVFFVLPYLIPGFDIFGVLIPALQRISAVLTG